MRQLFGGTMRFYNPVDDIVEGRVGRKIGRPPSIETEHLTRYKWSKEQVQYSFAVYGYEEHLYALCERGFIKFAVCVDNETVFNDFYSRYRSIQLFEFELYALKINDHRRASEVSR